MPALDLDMIGRLGRDLHSTSHTGLMAEDEVCPWTLFLTMALTLLKGVLPHVPRMLPVFISDPDLRAKAAETFTSEEFQNNIEEYFVQNIKSDIQTPLNRQILKSSETIMYVVDMMNKLVATFMGPETGEVLGAILNTQLDRNGAIGSNGDSNDLGTTDDKPRMNDEYYGGGAGGGMGGLMGLLGNGNLGKLVQFASTLYNLA